jgi:hypothetical protein
MGQTQTSIYVNFEEVQDMINTSTNVCLVNTLEAAMQSCLIVGTIHASNEDDIINELIKTNIHQLIIVYGLNDLDSTVKQKYDKLINCGFKNVKIYLGGLFEWLLLQEAFGFNLFQTTIKSSDVDLLAFKPKKQIQTNNIQLIGWK